MYRINFPRLLSAVLLFVLAACQPEAPVVTAFALKPGDTINGIALTTGASDAPPLWVFCSSRAEEDVKASNCQIPSAVSSVAIGEVFSIADKALINLDWSEYAWTMSLDEQPIDLTAFGTYDFSLPTMKDSPSRVREVFIRIPAWDVVLTNLKPGKHTLRGLAQSEIETYSWTVDFAVEKP